MLGRFFIDKPKHVWHRITAGLLPQSPVLLVMMWIYYSGAIDIANAIRALRRSG